MTNDQDRMERIVSLAKRRGFIFPSSEIYGGLNGFWDYGPLGVELKRNIKEAWWQDLVRSPPNGPDGKPIQMVGLDAAIIMNPKVWEASGHTTGFTDPMVDCKACKARFRADQVTCLLYGVKWTDGHMPEGDFFVFSALGTKEDVERKHRKKIDKILRGHRSDWPPYGDLATLASPIHDKVYVRIPCPECGQAGHLGRPRSFNMMFKTHTGAMEDSASLTYLRPETAQGIFANYKNVLDTTRLKLPFGIAQIGKAFRNEINPRNYTFRSREFEMMEIEFFCRQSEADKWYEYWRDARFQWYVGLGLKGERLRLRDHKPDELAHYAKACADIEYSFPFSRPDYEKGETVGFDELEGIANRTDFDLTRHQEASGRDMTYFDDETKERFIPYVIEPSGGVDRAALAFLAEAYDEDEAPDEKGKMRKRTVLRFHPRLAPIKVAVFPLVRKDGMPEKARAIWAACREHIATFYDEKGAVGRRYRRQDEAGTPFCVTVDGQTNEDGTVTIRDRDTMKQERIAAEAVLSYVRDHLHL
ncbi:MAG: glycine--tRNA ligase [Phycisphaerae bacterium]